MRSFFSQIRETTTGACLCWWLACVLSALLCPAHAASPQEYQVKAIFLFNFTQFVDWPAGSDANRPIAICILGEDPFGSFLDEALRGERVDLRPLVVRRYRRAEDIADCQILFVSQSEANGIDAIVGRVRDTGTLTVSDARDFGERGGMIAFVTEGNHVRLRINLAAARAAGLSISSKLLRVAELVGGDAR